MKTVWPPHVREKQEFKEILLFLLFLSSSPFFLPPRQPCWATLFSSPNVVLGPMRCYFPSKEETTTEICSLKVCNKRRKGMRVWKVWMSMTSKIGRLLYFKIWSLGGKGEKKMQFNVSAWQWRRKGQTLRKLSINSQAFRTEDDILCQGRHCYFSLPGHRNEETILNYVPNLAREERSSSLGGLTGAGIRQAEGSRWTARGLSNLKAGSHLLQRCLYWRHFNVTHGSFWREGSTLPSAGYREGKDSGQFFPFITMAYRYNFKRKETYLEDFTLAFQN